MIYNSFNFIVIFPLIFLLYYAIPAKYQKVRNLFLLLASYCLYVSWKPICVLILLGVTAISYCFAFLINYYQEKAKSILSIGIILSILPLLAFKYLNFINEAIYHVLSSQGICVQLIGLNWAIPIGISFFTFQALSYLWDVYYNKIEPERNFLYYALYLSFFPSILSGPINRASLIIPQLKNIRPYFDYFKAVEGLKMILWGMFMKVVVADRAGQYVDMVFPSFESYSGLTCFVASIVYTIQIYADFAGYSLMAIGVGKMLGFELTENFRRPYFADSVTDFWRRWHISLSSWLKDYIYIPMGGSHCSKLKNYFNIFITFLVSGIWHGANWTFIIWGIIHGTLQIIERMIGQSKQNYGYLGKSIKIAITFLLVNFAWIFFRMPTLSDACRMIGRIFDMSQPFHLEERPHTAALAFILMLLLKDLIDEFFPKHRSLFNSRYLIVRWCTYISIFVLIILEGVLGEQNFIYQGF